MLKKLVILGVGILLLLNSQVSQAAQYNIDTTHSTLGFAVRHLEVGTTRGGFGNYEGTINYDAEDLSAFNANVTIQANSIDTKLEARDSHLRNADFFDVENFPTITFKSNRLEKRGGSYAIVGDLTIKETTKQVTIPAQVSGPIESPFGSTVIGIKGYTNINRQDFGVSWNKSLDNGGFVVSDDVELVIEIEAHKK